MAIIKCPFCAEDIQDKAIKCKHCNSALNKSSVQSNNNSNQKNKKTIDVKAVIAKTLLYLFILSLVYTALIAFLEGWTGTDLSHYELGG